MTVILILNLKRLVKFNKCLKKNLIYFKILYIMTKKNTMKLAQTFKVWETYKILSTPF